MCRPPFERIGDGATSLSNQRMSPNECLLFLWAGLQEYQRHSKLLRFTADERDKILRRGVDYYRPVLDPDSFPPDYWEGEVAVTDEMEDIILYISGSQCAEKEMLLGAGSPCLLFLTTKQLSVMLGFVEIVCGDWRRPINPVIFCIWAWMQGKQTLPDNMVIQFPPSIRFVYPQEAGGEPTTHSPSAYVLDLSEECDIDVQGGGHVMGFAVWTSTCLLHLSSPSSPSCLVPSPI
jgi:hypothetical protein